MIVSSGQTVSITNQTIIGDIVVNGGTEIASSNGIASATVVSSGGQLRVSSGGKAIGANILSSGLLAVSSGGTASSTNVSGTETVYSGGLSTDSLIFSGGLQKLSGGTARNATILNGGEQDVFAGGVTSATVVAAGGTEIVHSGGLASATVIGANGVLEVGSGGQATGFIKFATSAGELQIDAAAPVATISGLVAGDTIDLAGSTYAPGGTATLTGGNVLNVIESGVNYSLQLDPSANFAGVAFKLKSDGGTGTLVYVDRAPVVSATLSSRTAAHGQSYAALALVTVTDPENDPITQYALWDTQGNGRWVVNGVAQATNTEIDITAAQLAQTVYQSGSGGTDTLFVRANDGTLWGQWASFTVSGTVDAAPVVTPTLSSRTATHNQSFAGIAAASLFSVSDAENDTITQYALWDVNGNGHWVVNGVVMATNTEIDITAAQLAQTVYRAGGSGTDQLGIRANDGVLWGSWAAFTVTATLDQAPVVNPTQTSTLATHPQSLTGIAAASLFTVSDAENDTITQYALWDTNGNGHWVVAGVVQATNAEIDISAAQLAQTFYVAGASGSDQLGVRANDGLRWGNWAAFTVTATPDAAPVVIPAQAATNSTHSQSIAGIAASSLFSVTDAEGDTITQYALWDTNGNGHWVVNGVVQATNVEIDITAAQLAQTVYQAGSNSTDQLGVRANDGIRWGNWSAFTVTGAVDAAPVVTATPASRTAIHSQSLTGIAASSLFTVSDADGDPITKYALWDTEGNGHWVLNGVVLGTNVEIDLTAAQLSQTVYQAGSGGTDHLYVRASDGILWGSWTTITVAGTIDQVPVVSVSNLLTVPFQSLAAANLFGVTDAENDTITKYALWDSNGNGHWVVNGFVQVTGAEIDISAAQLAQTVYQSGTGGTDQLYIRANDGILWGAWQGFTVGTVSPSTIPAGGTLELASAFAGNITFASSTGILKLDNASSFQGTVVGMTGSDMLDLTFVNFATAQTPAYSATGQVGALTVTDGTHTATLALLGDYSTSNFAISNDGHGGTFVRAVSSS